MPEKGCGPGLYVPQAAVEAEAVTGLTELLGVCADRKGLARRANEELRKYWEESNGYDPNAAARVQAVEAKIANVRRAIEDGLSDAAWANERLTALAAEREDLLGKVVVAGSCTFRRK